MSTYKQFVSEAAVSIWDATRAYKANDLVAHIGRIWRAKADHGARAFAPADWEAIGGGSIAVFNPTAAYKANAIVSNNGVLYRANQDSPGPLNSGNWTVIGGGPSIAGTHTSGVPNPTVGEDNDVVAVTLPDHGPVWTPTGAVAGLPAGQYGWSYSNPDYPGVTLEINATGSLTSATVGPGYDFIWLGSPLDPPFDTLTELTVFDGSNNRMKGTGATATTGGRKVTVKLPAGNAVVAAAFDAMAKGTAGSIFTDAPGLPQQKGENALYAKISGAWTRVDSSVKLPLTNYADNTAYKKDDIVVRAGNLYRAKADIAGGPAFVAAEWDSVSPKVTHPINAYDATATYAVNDLVISSGKLYRAKVKTAAGPMNPAQWDEIGKPLTRHLIDLFDTTVAYEIGDTCYKDGAVWTASVKNGPGAFNVSQWTLSDGPGVYAFSQDINYPKDAFVTRNGKLFKAKSPQAKGPFSAAGWDEIGSGLAMQSVGAGTHTAANNILYLVRTGTSAATLNLPPGTLNARIGFKDYNGKFDVNNLTIAPAAGEKIESQTAPLVIDKKGWSGVLQYFNAAVGWLLVESSPATSGGGGGVAGPIVAFDATAAYAKDDLVVQASKIYRAKAAVAAGAFDPAEWDRSVAGINFDTKPDDSVGVDGDLISVSRTVVRNYCFRTKNPAKDPAHNYSGGTMYGLVNDGVTGSKDYILVRPGPTVQMYITGKLTSPFPDGTIVHWEVDKFTWSSHVETKLAKGATNVPPSFSGTPTQWDKLLDDIAANPPNVQYIDVWGFLGRTTPAVRFFARENGAWEELYGEMDSLTAGLASRTASGAIAARGLSFRKDTEWIINYVDMHTYRGTYSFGTDALREITAGTVDTPQGRSIIAIGTWAGRDASARLKTGANSEPSGASVAIGDGAGASAKTLSGSTVVGADSAASAGKLSQSSFFGQGGFPGFHLGGMQYFEYSQCTGIGANSLIASGAPGKIEKCTALGANAGHPAKASNAPAAARIHALCAGSHNVTLLGYNAEPTGTYTKPSVNQIVLGDHNIQHIYAKVRSISALSDERDKKDITDLSLGLDFINGLRPVSFEWDDRDGSYKGVKSIGFIAQEVLKAENDSGMRDHLQMVDEEVPDKLKMSEGQLIPILTKAVQELSAQVEELKKEVAALKGA